MTTPETDQAAPMLPGLEEPTRAEPAIVRAARRTIAAVEASGLLTERDALTCALVLDLAEAVATGKTGGRASAAAMAAAQLLAAMDRLPKPPEGGGDGGDPYANLAEQLRQAAREAGLAT